MFKWQIVLFLISIFPYNLMAGEVITQNNDCTTQVFANAISSTADNIDQNAPEIDVKQWVFTAFSSAETLRQILACPEITSVGETETIKFTPIQYTFPNGRKIVVNYETQPRVLKQRLSLLNKRPLPSDEISPKIGPDSDALWTNTDPAWYGIMVVEHGALDDFIGPDKNYTISLKYINDNIDKLYPRGAKCTNKSALARNNAAINRATTNAIDLKAQTDKKDTNDYYVAGDVNLQWISYAEIALDVAITVLTLGGGVVISGATKAARAARALDGLKDTIKALDATTDVIKYKDALRALDRINDQIKKLDKTKDAAKIADLNKELNSINNTLKTLSKTDDVKKYRDAAKTFSDLNKYRRSLRALKTPQRGNIIARMARATKATFSGNKKIKHALKLGRSGTFSGQIRNWLFDSTLKNAGTLAKIEATGGLLYGAINLLGEMYDYTSTSTDQYTNGIEFKPLLLLSADDLSGQENVVNYGMWLLFAGSSTDVSDDDAAYLQAMDFAAKFHEDLLDVQNNTNSPCNVDIFVVRPILRNPDTDNADLFYLIMNSTPWTTNDK